VDVLDAIARVHRENFDVYGGAELTIRQRGVEGHRGPIPSTRSKSSAATPANATT